MTEFTDANDFEIALYRNYIMSSCNGFAWAYVKENPEAVVKVGEMEGGSEHCWVFDPGLNLTIDPTLGQFDGLEDGYWEGEEHPHCYEEWETWDDKEAFAEHYDAPMSPFVV